MKLQKVRLLFFLTVTIIFYISFKILEPEIEGDKEGTQEKFGIRNAGNVAFVNDLENNEQINVGHLKFDINLNEPLEVNSSREDIKEWLLQRYQVQWDRYLEDSPWKVAASWVTHRLIVPDNVPELGAILKEMSTAKILKADVGHKGTQLKMSLILEGGQKVAFKPKWFNRDHVIEGIYEGQDRHNGEVASFHLSRLMGLGKTPLAVGRTVDLLSEIKPVATSILLNTYFTKDNNTCFYGKCMYCKSKKDGVCGEGSKLEGTIVLFLPPEWSHFKYQRHPWQRTYKKGVKAVWEKSDGYCNEVKQIPLYGEGPRLLDITDASVFDYLIGNADRHHYESFTNFTTTSIMIMFDNGKSFGNPYHDELSILAPVYQCCRLRKRTMKRLQLLGNGIISEVLREILAGDPIAPILDERYYTAMDRRLNKIYEVVEACISTYGENNVLIDDGYS